MTKKEYNGWYNYETWNVKLWIDNDQGTQEYWLEQTKEVLGRDLELDEDEINDKANELSKLLENEHRENTPTVTGCYADLLNASLSEVNWYEIAKSMIDDYIQENK